MTARTGPDGITRQAEVTGPDRVVDLIVRASELIHRCD